MHLISVNVLFLLAAMIMLRGGNMRFRSAIFFWFVFAQSFFKFHKNGDIRKLKAWSFRLWKNDFRRLYNERARALQSSITFFFIHPVYTYTYTYLCISCFIGKSIFNIFILFPGLLSQSSFVQAHFKFSFKSMQSSFENHNSCRINSCTQHLEANFVIFW